MGSLPQRDIALTQAVPYMLSSAPSSMGLSQALNTLMTACMASCIIPPRDMACSQRQAGTMRSRGAAAHLCT